MINKEDVFVKNNAISLISLIITIIVIIILAALVIGFSTSTPEKAAFAKFSSDITEIQNAVNIAYSNEYGKYSLNEATVDKTQLYNWVATKTLDNAVGKIPINEESGNNNVGMNLPKYPGQTWMVDVENGIVSLEPGYIYNEKIYSTVEGENYYPEGELKLFYTILKDDEDLSFTTINIEAKVGGVPTYEEYATNILVGKTVEEKAQMIVDYEATTYADYYDYYYEGQEIDLELVLYDYGCTTLEELYIYFGYDSLDEYLIGEEIVDYDNYDNQYGSYIITLTYPDNVTTVESAASLNAKYAVTSNGVYTFKAVCGELSAELDVNVSDITNNNLSELEKVDGIYQINNIEELLTLSENVNGGKNYTGETIKLMNSLDFNSDASYNNPNDTSTFGDYNDDGSIEGIKTEVTKITGSGFKPIGSKKFNYSCGIIVDKSFKGTFDGNNKQINNYYINTVKVPSSNVDYLSVGIFGFNSGTIQNLNVSGVISDNQTIKPSECSIGGLVGYNYNGEINNCEAIVDVTASYSVIGGLVGTNYGVINDCTSSLDIHTNVISSIGGVVANNYGEITNCYNAKDIILNLSNSMQYDDDEIFLGGIVGYSGSATLIENCYNSGNISINLATYQGYCYDFEQTFSTGNGDFVVNEYRSLCNNVGGIAGFMTDSEINNCYNTGSIYSKKVPSSTNKICGCYDNYVGGIIGEAYTSLISSCYNQGYVKGEGVSCRGYIAGIVGSSRNENTIENVYNTGSVENTSAGRYVYTGGIAGISCNTEISSSYNSGHIFNKDNLKGGYNWGEVNMTLYSAGIVASNTGSYSTTNNCYNAGLISSLFSKTVEGTGFSAGVSGIASYSASGCSLVNNYNVGTLSFTSSSYILAGEIIKSKGGIITNNYYLTGRGFLGISSGDEAGKTIPMTDANMKNSAFVDILNTGQTSTKWKVDTGVNNGYPILIWQ
jgi:type II secretory pathway pseudopilin PulG